MKLVENVIRLPYFTLLLCFKAFFINWCHFFVLPQVAEMYRHASLGVDVNIVVAKILLLQGNQVRANPYWNNLLTMKETRKCTVIEINESVNQWLFEWFGSHITDSQPLRYMKSSFRGAYLGKAALILWYINDFLLASLGFFTKIYLTFI